MVFIKLRCRPEDEKATLGVRITTASPKLSLAALKTPSSAPVLQIQIHLRCLKSVDPDKPITFCTSGTLFETAAPDHGPMDNLAQGMLGPGLVCRNPKDSSTDTKTISLGNFRVHRARQDNDDAVNLLERPGIAVITVPAQTADDGVTFTHSLSAERLFAFAEEIGPEDLRVGETYEMRTNDDYIGAMWWCWGSFEGSLKGKKLHSFSEGFNLAGSEERPSEEEVEKSGWVIGEDVSQLLFRLEEGGATCTVEVVE